jgi:hypothetical protein
MHIAGGHPYMTATDLREEAGMLDLLGRFGEAESYRKRARMLDELNGD